MKESSAAAFLAAWEEEWGKLAPEFYLSWGQKKE